MPRQRRPRDATRQRVYNAEYAVQELLDGPYRHRKMSKDEARAYVDRVFRSRWMKSHYPGVAQAYRLGMIDLRMVEKMFIRSSGGRHGINLSQPGRCPSTIIHEIAHVVHHRCLGGEHQTPHGWQWASIQLELVRHFLGTEAGRALRRAYRKHRVRYTAPRTLSPEQRAACVARLQAYRLHRIAA